MYKTDFPLLRQNQITYLDSAASTQKPEVVLKRMTSFYESDYANVHRGNCEIASRATEAYEKARHIVADFIQAESSEIIFTKGTTESINLVAASLGQNLTCEDEVLVSVAEHHANFVPWQQMCLKTGAQFKVCRVLPSGAIDMADFESKLSKKTKIVAVTHLSNVLGVVNPIEQLIQKAHQVGALVLIDGAQSIAHLPVHVHQLDCDFFAFSGHKLYGPTGIGVLYGKKSVLASLPPYQFGGDMIRYVGIEKTTFADSPAKFEAGTPPFVEAIGLGEAIQYLKGIGLAKIMEHERKLTQQLLSALGTIPNLVMMGAGDASVPKHGLASFNVKGIHPADIAFVLAKQGICVRIGHHCAMPIHHFFNQEISLRVSLGLYNDEKDISSFMESFEKALCLLKGI